MPSINLNALHSDETELFHSPLEPKAGDIVTIRFRTAKDDVDEVVLVCGKQEFYLEKETSTDVFDYYKTEIVAEDEIIRYYFEVRKNDEVVIYNRRGVFYDVREQYQFAIVPGFETPKWAKGAVMYQIFVDRFYNGDPTNDVESGEYIYIGEPCTRVKDWNKYPAYMGVREFYAGDFQ
jgi:alpha-glucosidase